MEIEVDVRARHLRRKLDKLEAEELRQLVQDGIESGPDLDAEPVFARLRARFGATETG